MADLLKKRAGIEWFMAFVVSIVIIIIVIVVVAIFFSNILVSAKQGACQLATSLMNTFQNAFGQTATTVC